MLYRKAIIVFGSYTGGPNTKDNIHERCSQNWIGTSAKGITFLEKKKSFECGEQAVSSQPHLAILEGHRLPCDTSQGGGTQM